MTLATGHSPDRRLIGFLAISVALHLLWLAIPLSTRGSQSTLVPLVARLTPPASPQKSAVAVRQARGSVAAPAAQDTANVQPVAATPEPAVPAINLEAAFATARSQTHAAPPRTTLDAPKPELTVEAAVARATRTDALVETRGAAGEYVTMIGKSRCVTPLVVPHFLEGKTMLTQCETRKG
jgi:hypothetical protein